MSTPDAARLSAGDVPAAGRRVLEVDGLCIDAANFRLLDGGAKGTLQGVRRR